MWRDILHIASCGETYCTLLDHLLHFAAACQIQNLKYPLNHSFDQPIVRNKMNILCHVVDCVQVYVCNCVIYRHIHVNVCVVVYIDMCVHTMGVIINIF